MSSRKIKIGTRGSPLALCQARQVKHHLMQAHDMHEDQFEIHIIQTTGDQIQDKALRAFGGKGLFTKEIEEALLAKRIDIAVHSMKDMPTRYPDGLTVSCILEREDVRDAFLSPKAQTLSDLPKGATLGTSSLRRQAQVKKKRPDLEVVTFRGNVQTRLQKLESGNVDATLLAYAGLKRLEMEHVITSLISTDDMLPAVAQGALGIETRLDDVDVAELLAPVNHPETALCIAVERAFLAQLDGSCQTPIAGLARVEGDIVHFKGQILKPDGTCSFETEGASGLSDGILMSAELARQLLTQAGDYFFSNE